MPLKNEHLENPLFGVDMADYIRSYCEYVIGEGYEMQKQDGGVPDVHRASGRHYGLRAGFLRIGRRNTSI